MTLENVTSAGLASKSAKLLRKIAEIRLWLGGRESNPDTVVQSHVSYRWTTSQCQSRTVERRELAIIANPNWSEQVRRLTPERRSSGSIVSAGNRSRSSIRSIRGQYWVFLHPAAVAAACGDGWPSRPSVRPRALLRWST